MIEVSEGVDVLDESLLILGLRLDGGSGLLLLTTAAGGKEDTTEQGAEDTHGELLHEFVSERSNWQMTNGSCRASTDRPVRLSTEIGGQGGGRQVDRQIAATGRETYEVRADLLAGDLVVDDHVD